MAPKRTQRLSALQVAMSRTLAPVPDLPAAEPAPAPAVEPEQPPSPAAAGQKATRQRKQSAAMPAEQPSKTPKGSKPEAFPARITLQLTAGQAQALDNLLSERNGIARAAGRGKPYAVNPVIRAALDLCLNDARLKELMLKKALDPQHTGRPLRTGK